MGVTFQPRRLTHYSTPKSPPTNSTAPTRSAESLEADLRAWVKARKCSPIVRFRDDPRPPPVPPRHASRNPCPTRSVRLRALRPVPAQSIYVIHRIRPSLHRGPGHRRPPTPGHRSKRRVRDQRPRCRPLHRLPPPRNQRRLNYPRKDRPQLPGLEGPHRVSW